LKLTRQLSIEGISLRVRLGLLAVEKLSPVLVSIDLQWRGISDPDRPSVDYSEVCSRIREREDRVFVYIEDLAGEILEMLCSSWSGHWKVSVSKHYPPAALPMLRAVCTLEGDGL